MTPRRGRGASGRGLDRERPSGRRRPTVLVADDDPVLPWLARVMLEDVCTVRPAGDGQQALAMLRREPFDLALLDVRMPRLSGPEVVQQLREDVALRHLPVVLVSADTTVGHRLSEIGADAYIAKPYDPARLRRVVELGLIGRQALRRPTTTGGPAALAVTG